MAQKGEKAAARGEHRVADGPAPPVASPGGEVILGVADLRPDAANRRRRTSRGAGMLRDSLHQVGAARSIVIDEANGVLAGNGMLEAAAEVGIHRVRVIDAEGDELIAVRRSNLSPDQKRQLAIYDNRTGELAEWDPDQIATDVKQGLALEPFFTDAEVRGLVKDTSRQPVVKEVPTTDVADQFWISIRGPLEAQAYALQRLRTLMTDLKGVSVQLGTIQALELTPLG